ncbi:sensor histidine kinase [Oryzifoliimicrobium ureilyticus]|uniref:sensor histidine kinase n=1 Tax=Oryzifoliimicrobium ureilyticus TaxID=3113724 RepID=UPI0030765C5E
MKWSRRWNTSSLASQFFFAGGIVSIVALISVGLIVTSLIQNAVIHNYGAATALYVDSVIAPLLPDMQRQALLDDGAARALDETLGQGALGRRLVSFNLWRNDGTVLYSNNKALVGRKFPVNAKLQQAFSGTLVARYEIAKDPESAQERLLGKALMEIYNPVLQPWSGQAVAVAEFYESADGLDASLGRARVESWLAVAGITLLFFFTLSAIVFRGNRTIEAQRSDLKNRVEELSSLLSENQALQRRLRRASQRVAALNETYLRSIGADLHDGPTQHIAYASLRLDSDVLIDASTKPDVREQELSWIRSSLAEAITEIRNICQGLMLPQIESASFKEIVERVVDAHQRNTKTAVDTNIDSEDPELAAAVKICVYRFIQEALNNAYRHGGGLQQSVKAVARNGRIHVEVSDRGDGFDPSEIRPTSLGLAGMRERIDSLGGEFNVVTGQQGTTVTMSFGRAEMEDMQ